MAEITKLIHCELERRKVLKKSATYDMVAQELLLYRDKFTVWYKMIHSKCRHTEYNQDVKN